jgi:hypothetical protein
VRWLLLHLGLLWLVDGLSLHLLLLLWLHDNLAWCLLLLHLHVWLKCLRLHLWLLLWLHVNLPWLLLHLWLHGFRLHLWLLLWLHASLDLAWWLLLLEVRAGAALLWLWPNSCSRWQKSPQPHWLALAAGTYMWLLTCL